MYTALTIAGSDSVGGAGIQADIKTMTVLGVYSMAVITSMTAQNTTGVFAVQPSTPDFLEEQLKAVLSDILPDAVKIGMISTAEQVEVIARSLLLYGAKNIVVDPVITSTSGATLTCGSALDVMQKKLFPVAAVITPNLVEAQTLMGDGRAICNTDDMARVAKELSQRYGCSVLVKGGHLSEDAADVLKVAGGDLHILRTRRIANPNSHGTGCTLSSAIASYLAMGEDLVTVVSRAKDYITGCLAAGLNLGKGRGPLNHMWNLRQK